MIKFCLEKWDKNKSLLEKELRSRTDLNSCGYLLLVQLVVTHIFNDGKQDDHYDYGNGSKYDADHITEIDNGDYQGTLLFVIPRHTYQPSEDEYLMTYVGYGSCSGCDTLQGIQDYREARLTDQQVADFLTLCKDIVQNTIRPYNFGWRHDTNFDPVEEVSA